MPSAWENRFAGWLKRIAGLRESTDLSVLPDLMPMLDVFAGKPELALPRGEVLLTAGTQGISAAGQFATVEILERSDQNSLLVLESLLIASTSPGQRQISIVTGNAVGAGVGSGFPDDARVVFGSTLGHISIFSSEVVALGVQRPVYIVGGQETLVLPYRCVLTPGRSLRVQDQVGNTHLCVLALGYERSAQFGELGNIRA